MAYAPLSTAHTLAADAQSLGALKLDAGKATPAAIRETAKQFESLFMRELLKSMREATMKSGLLDSPGGDLGTDLLDQQFAVQMSGQPGGLTDQIVQQLTRQMGAQQACHQHQHYIHQPGSHAGRRTGHGPTRSTHAPLRPQPSASRPPTDEPDPVCATARPGRRRS